MKKLFTPLAAILVLGGCATSSPITEIEPNKYIVSSQVAMCISCAPGAQSIKTAKAFCEEKGEKLELIDSSSGTNIYGYKTNNELIFKCKK